MVLAIPESGGFGVGRDSAKDRTVGQEYVREVINRNGAAVKMKSLLEVLVSMRMVLSLGGRGELGLELGL